MKYLLPDLSFCYACVWLCRNIVEKSHGELVNYRRANFCDVDKSTLAQFKKAIEGDWKRERHETRRPYPRPLILGLLFIGLLVIALVTMTTVCYNVCTSIIVLNILFQVVILSVVIPEGDMGFIQKPVSEWNNDDVMAWLGGLGDWASHNISKVFSKEVFYICGGNSQFNIDNYYC